MRNIFEKTRFRQENVEIEQSLVLGTLNGGDLLKVGSDAIAELTPDDAESVLNVIDVGIRTVVLGANVNGVTDFVTLPALASTPDGATIMIIAGAANCELRTPALSAEEINSEDCDGTKELLLTGTQISWVTKISDAIGWQHRAMTAIGAVAAAVVPD